MKFTPSAQYITESKAAAHTVTWNIYHRRTSSLSTGLSAGTWIESTSRIDDLPDVTTRIEHDLGVFTADNISLSGRDVAWWRSNIFTGSTNLITNGSFETDVSNWTAIGNATITRNTTTPISGTADAIVATVDANDGIKSNTFSIASGSTYKVTFKIRKASIAGVIKWRVVNSADDTYVLGSPSIDTELYETVSTRKQLRFTAEESVTGYLLFYAEDGTTASFYIDDISVTAEEYNEIKILCKIGTASDTINVYHGWIDEKDIEYNEIMDSVSFSAYTVEDLASRFPVTMINTQYLRADANGSGDTGLILPNIPDVYVMDAGVAGKELSVGVHTITFNNGNLKLDDGAYTATTTLSNADDSQRLTMYYRRALSGIEVTNGTATDTIIVVNRGTTLPKQPYVGLSVSQYLRLLYGAVGMTDISIDTLTMPTWDGDKRLSRYNLVGLTVTDEYKTPICTNGNDIYASSENKIYKKNGDAWDLVVTVTSTYTPRILRLWYSSSGKIYILYTTTYADRMLRLYDIQGDTLSAELELNATLGTIPPYNISLVDFEYDTDNYRRGLIFADSGSDGIYWVEENALTVTKIPTPTIPDPPRLTLCGNFHYQRVNGATLEIYFQTYTQGTLYFNYFGISLNIDGDFETGTVTAEAYNEIYVGAYNQTDDKIYYLYDNKIKSHPHGSNTTTDLKTGISSSIVDGGIYSSGMYTYVFTPGDGSTTFPINPEFNVVSNNTVIYSDEINFWVNYGGISYGPDRLWIIDNDGYLWQYHNVINMYINQTFIDSSIRDVINKIFISYNLAGVTNPKKQAIVYRRSDDSGNVVTSGNTMAVTVSNASDITLKNNCYQGYDIVELSNDEYITLYDGMNFESGNIGASTLSITSELIPSIIIDDLAKYIWAFYCVGHSVYVIPCGNYPMLQYECFDGASISLASQKISTAVSGIIYAVTVNKFGQVTAEVLS